VISEPVAVVAAVEPPSSVVSESFEEESGWEVQGRKNKKKVAAQ